MRNKSKLRAANPAQSNWSQGLLTLSSIILGAAVAVGAEKIFKTTTSTEGIDLEAIWQAAAAFMFTAGTFYHTFTVVSFFFVLPNILWVMLPLAVGGSVIMSAYAIGNAEHSLISGTIFFASGTAIFLYALLELRFGRVGILADSEVDRDGARRCFVYEMTKNSICFFLMLSISSVTLCLVKFFGKNVSKSLYFIPLANIPIYFAMVVLTEFKFLREIERLWLSREKA